MSHLQFDDAPFPSPWEEGKVCLDRSYCYLLILEIKFAENLKNVLLGINLEEDRQVSLMTESWCETGQWPSVI